MLIELVDMIGLGKAFLQNRLGNQRSTTFSTRRPSPDVPRQQKWHRLRHLVRGEVQAAVHR